jgi:hypothetical protein
MSQPPNPTIEGRLDTLPQSIELLYRDQQQDAQDTHALTLIARDALASVQSRELIASAHRQRLDDAGQRIRRHEEK